jgi:adenylate cyclase
MPVEIERKFLVKRDLLPALRDGVHLVQGYLTVSAEVTVRVRIKGEKAFITVKGKSAGLSRPEFEYETPLQEAKEILEKLCVKPLIEKTRYILPDNGQKWEVDVFENENEGLILAEIELNSEDQQVWLPPWAAEEVTGKHEYSNSNLVRNPYKSWKKS